MLKAPRCHWEEWYVKLTKEFIKLLYGYNVLKRWNISPHPLFPIDMQYSGYIAHLH